MNDQNINKVIESFIHEKSQTPLRHIFKKHYLRMKPSLISMESKQRVVWESEMAKSM